VPEPLATFFFRDRRCSCLLTSNSQRNRKYCVALFCIACLILIIVSLGGLGALGGSIIVLPFLASWRLGGSIIVAVFLCG
jgi:hypothetical protein